MAADGPLRHLDERAGAALRGGGCPAGLARLLADLGDAAVAPVVLLLAIGHTAGRSRAAGTDRWWLPPLGAAAALALVPALVGTLKALVGRPGPPGMAGGGFYPSGHAATAAVALGAAAWLLARRPPGRVRLVAGPAVVLNLGAGYGLVRQGYHWPLDVLASWCLAGALLTVLARLVPARPLPGGDGGARSRTGHAPARESAQPK